VEVFFENLQQVSYAAFQKAVLVMYAWHCSIPGTPNFYSFLSKKLP
jgi:hypothetical protein